MTPVVMPLLGNWEETKLAIGDVLCQHTPVRLLLIDQGRRCFSEIEKVKQHAGAVESWHPDPPLTSLSATWNTALDYCWSQGAEHAWVVNNDARFRVDTLSFLLKAFEHYPEAGFISAFGVEDPKVMEEGALVITSRGGPDFSCFVITKELHGRERFDEGFTPAYCEDLDYHRRMLLAGQGDAIFSVGCPYYHQGSGTLRNASEADREAIQAAIRAGSRVYYEKKWGGPVNQERFNVPFGAAGESDDCRTPVLFEEVRQGWATEISRRFGLGDSDE